MMDSVDFRKVRNILQPIFSCTIVTATATHEVLVLSDSGLTVDFTVKEFMMSVGNKPVGLWKGHLETVNETRYCEISFLKYVFYYLMGRVTETSCAWRPPPLDRGTVSLWTL